MWGFELNIRFPIVKLIDYRKHWDDLDQSDNPFAFIVMTHLKFLDTQKNPADRLNWKFALIKKLYQRGYSRDDIVRLFAFIDWIMVLPKELEERFQKDLSVYEGENHMPYITSIERIGIRKGIEIGIQQGIQQGALLHSRQSLVEALETRFKKVPKTMIAKINKIDDTTLLKQLFKTAILASSLKEFRETLNQKTM